MSDQQQPPTPGQPWQNQPPPPQQWQNQPPPPPAGFPPQYIGPDGAPVAGPDPNAPAASQPKKKNFTGLIILGVIVALVFGGIWFANRDKVDNAEVGDCMKLDESDDKSPFTVVDCNDPEGKYKVLKVISDPNEHCKDIAGASQSSSTDDNDTVCMGEKGVDPATAVNVAKEGDCLVSQGDDAKRVDCASPEATDKVLKRMTDVMNFRLKQACADVEGATSYYTWTWKSYGGSFNVPSLSADVVLCLGPAKTT